ncbi:hypothetical protein [Myxosarcina sp. GI1(2024)]
MFRLIHLIALAVGILAFIGNILFGLYITVLKLTSNRLVPLSLSSALLLVWIVISFAAYFLVGIAGFSDSEEILARLTPSLIILAYLVIGLGVFWSFKIIEFRA